MSPEVIQGTVWVAIMAVAIIVEIMTVDMTSIWFAGGALIASIAAYCGLSITVQIIIFMVLSALLLLALKPLMKKRLKVEVTPTNADELIGEVYPVLSNIGPGKATGQIKIRDVEWRAVSEDGAAIGKDTPVKILRIEGTKLVVEPADTFRPGTGTAGPF